MVGRRKKSLVTWVQSADQAFIAVGAGATVIHQSRSIGGDETTMRTRGILAVKPAVFTADVGVSGAFGFAYVSDQAFAAGAASIPGPYTNASWDGWFVHQFWSFHYTVGAGHATGPGLLDTVIWEVDSKGMRKGKDGDTLVVMVESQAAVADVSLQFRELVKVT